MKYAVQVKLFIIKIKNSLKYVNYLQNKMTNKKKYNLNKIFQLKIINYYLLQRRKRKNFLIKFHKVAKKKLMIQ